MDYPEFEKFKLEMDTRAYKSKTKKSYIYYNEKFLEFINKKPYEIVEEDIKYFIKEKLKTSNKTTINFIISSDRKSTRLNSSHTDISRMPSSA